MSGHIFVPEQLPVCIHTNLYPVGGVKLVHSTDPVGHPDKSGPFEPDGPSDPDGPLGGCTPGFELAQLAEVDVGPIDPLEPDAYTLTA